MLKSEMLFSIVSEAYKLQVDYSVIKHFLEKDIVDFARFTRRLSGSNL
jgi:hypothetical protein